MFQYIYSAFEWVTMKGVIMEVCPLGKRQTLKGDAVAEGCFVSRLGLITSAVCRSSTTLITVLIPTDPCSDVDSYFCRARETGLLSETH
jgi:hypothetical protein